MLRGLWFRCSGAAAVVGLVDAAVVDAVGIGPDQRVVSVVDHGDGKSAGEAGDAGERPSAGEAIGAEELVEGQLILVAEDEVVLHVEGRERVAERRVEGVDLFADVGRLVQRFAVGVGGGELEAAAGVAGAEFERVVVGVADVGLQRVAAEVGSERAAGSVDLAAADGEVDGVFAAWAAGQGAGLTSLGWLRLRHSAGLPALDSISTRWRWLEVPT